MKKIQSNNDIKSIYNNILQSENFETNEPEQQYHINSTNNNQSQSIAQISQTPNDEQKSILDTFKHILLHGAQMQQSQHNKPPIFLLTGAPGARKSYTVKLIIQMTEQIGKTVIATS